MYIYNFIYPRFFILFTFFLSFSLFLSLCSNSSTTTTTTLILILILIIIIIIIITIIIIIISLKSRGGPRHTTLHTRMLSAPKKASTPLPPRLNGATEGKEGEGREGKGKEGSRIKGRGSETQPPVPSSITGS